MPILRIRFARTPRVIRRLRGIIASRVRHSSETVFVAQIEG